VVQQQQQVSTITAAEAEGALRDVETVCLPGVSKQVLAVYYQLMTLQNHCWPKKLAANV